MTFHDLDLEFEDEEDSKKKKEAVDVGVDLQFSHRADASKVMDLNKIDPPHKSEETKKNTAHLKIVDSPAPVATASVKTASVGATALKSEPSIKNVAQEIFELQERVRQVEFESQVKIAVADFKAEILSDLMSDIKVLELQVGQLLARVHAKSPDTKQEVLMIKKVLTDFCAKKRK